MKILFVGLGNLGSQVFDMFLLRAIRGDTFLVAGRNLEHLQQRTSFPLYAALQLGGSPDVECAFMDVQNVEQTAQTIANFQPDVIFTSVTVQPSSAISKLPKPLFEKLAPAGPGPWLPLTLVLVYKLMQAVKLTGLKITILNGAAPDNAHAILGKVGLAPTTGVGNLGNLIPAIRRLVAMQVHRPIERVQIFFIGHNQVAHHLRMKGTPSNIPYHLSIFVDDRDVTRDLDLSTIFNQLPATLAREHTQILSAASATAVFDAITTKLPSVLHAPGPNGLPGAYPIRAHGNGVEVVLPPGLTLEQAIQINQEGQKLDGIEKIDHDGTIWFTERNMMLLKEVLGYECRRVPLSEVEERAKELRARFLALSPEANSERI